MELWYKVFLCRYHKKLYKPGNYRKVKNYFGLINCKQWWILSETNEAVASDLPFFWGAPIENSTYRFISLQMFFRDHYEVGTKNGKYKIDSR